MVTRRAFIGAGIGAAVAARAFAMPGDKMRYAMSGHQFRTSASSSETGIKMAARYGYHGLEPFQDDMPEDPEPTSSGIQEAARRLPALRCARSVVAANISIPRATPTDHPEQRRSRSFTSRHSLAAST